MVNRFLSVLSLLLIAMPTMATDRPTQQDQRQEQGQSQNQSSEQANTQTTTVESKHQAPATFISTPSSTAPCVVANGWSVGVPGAGGGRNKSRIDAECWTEYVKQAEHQRAVDLAKLELERERLRLESLKLENCLECEAQK